MPNGVFFAGPGGTPVFVPAPALTDDDVRRIAETTAHRVVNLRMVDEDTLAFTLKTPWSDGTTHLVLSPLELIEKLAALVPRPRLNLIRYHGVLALNAAGRAQIVPGHRPDEAPPEDVSSDAPCAHAAPNHTPKPAYRLSWGGLLFFLFAPAHITVRLPPTCAAVLMLGWQTL